MSAGSIRVVYPVGGWATNIGNSFYNLGMIAMLRSVPGIELSFATDMIDWVYPQRPGLEILPNLEGDLFIFSGPYFSPEFVSNLEIYRQLVRRGGHIAFVSVGQSRYNGSEGVYDALHSLGDGLAFVATRDRGTYETFRGLECPVYDGICTSAYLGDWPAARLEREPYVVLNFSPENEPTLMWSDGQIDMYPASAPRSFPAGHRLMHDWAPGRVGRSFARRVLERRERRGGDRWATAVGPYEIVRAHTGVFDRPSASVFERPNTYSYDMPFGYLSLYQSADIVFTDRVHTAAAAMVLGGTARYVFSGDRARDGRYLLLERLGAGAVTREPTRLDLSRVEFEREALTAFVADQVRSLSVRM